LLARRVPSPRRTRRARARRDGGGDPSPRDDRGLLALRRLRGWPADHQPVHSRPTRRAGGRPERLDREREPTLEPRPQRPALTSMDRPLATPVHRIPYHVGIATCDLDRARAHLGELFGVEWSPTRTVEGELPTVGAYAGPTRRLHSLGGPMRLEVIEGTPESVWATTRVAELHHYAYWSADVAADVRALVGMGWQIEMATVDS